ncbi:MAG TPA: urease accessory protein UreD [Acidimicrobiales bacterium]|nr:urease accessory protein UreD [Acidimicrobiales bacterium]
MRSSAAIVVGPNERGGVSFPTLRCEPPLTARPTAEGLHFIGTAAGPVGGDNLTLSLAVLPLAALTVRSVAAQLLYPGARRGPSRASVDVSVGAGASLRWLPEPMVAIDGADHRVTTVIDLAPDASLVWREVVVLGRHDELSGSVSLRLRVERGGRPLVCNELRLGPAWPHSAGPAGVGSHRVIATTLVIGAPAPWPAPMDGARIGVCELGSDAALITSLADEVAS